MTRGAAPEPRSGLCPDNPPKGAAPLETPRRAFGPLDTHSGSPAQGCSFARVTAHDGCAATRSLKLAAAAAGRVLRLWTRAEGFAIIGASLLTSAFGGLATDEASPSALLRCSLPVVLVGNLSHYYASCINLTLHPEGAKVSTGRRLASGESAEGGSRKRSDNGRKALWGVRLSSPVATKRKPNESAETSGLWTRRLRLRTPPQRQVADPALRRACRAP